MVTARDLPLVIDDLCLSASPKLQQKYRDLGAQFVREGTNASGISKKAGNQTMSFSCNAGIILTAEFALENPSDMHFYPPHTAACCGVFSDAGADRRCLPSFYRMVPTA